MDREIMKSRYESLPLKELREVAKARGLKSITALRKGALVERMLQADEAEEAANAAAAAAAQPEEEEAAPVHAEKPETKEKKQERRPAGQQYRKPRIVTTQPSGESRNGKAYTYSAEQREDENQNSRAASRQNAEEEADRRTGRTDNERQADRTENGRQTENRDSKQNEADEKNENLNAAEGPMERAYGILEVLSDGYGFIRSDNFMPGDEDVYVSPAQIRRFRMKTGDMITGQKRARTDKEKFSALFHVDKVNDLPPEAIIHRQAFEDMTPIFPNERIRLERPGGSVAMRIVDLVSPIGKGQRGMIVSPPKAGKTTLVKDAAKSILRNNPEMHVMILLIDERPEEVTDIKETVKGPNVEVIYSTFDELPEHHKRVSEMVIERAKRLVESKKDVIIFIDSITRLARAYNQVVPPSGRTLSGGLDPAALHMPKRFFGAARNMREGGSLTILATALVDTGSKMDDVVYEEFKGTGNMELILDRKLQERRVFPAIDLAKSGTRREDLLLDKDEQEAVNNMRRALVGLKAEEAGENILNMFTHTRNNRELVQILKKQRIV